jgi:phage terminase Nu1 subunit (DNA packaging protein)
MLRAHAKTIVTTSELARLFDLSSRTIADLGKRKIIVKGSKRGLWRLSESVSGYVGHLREEAARSGKTASEVNAKLRKVESEFAKMQGELVEADAVKKLWNSKLRTFRNRILAIPRKVPIPQRAADVVSNARASCGAR